MRIWVDADACPVVIREILFKAAQRTGVELTLVANQSIKTETMLISAQRDVTIPVSQLEAYLWLKQ